MRLFAAVLFAAFIAVVGATAAAQTQKTEKKEPEKKEKEKTTAEKLVGEWKLTSTTGKFPKDGTAVVMYTKDGKMTITITLKTSDEDFVMKGTYKINKDRITYSVKLPNGRNVFAGSADDGAPKHPAQ